MSVKKIKIKFINLFYSFLKPLVKIFFAFLLKVYFKFFPKKRLNHKELRDIIVIIPPQNGLGDNIMFSYYIDNLAKNNKINIYIVSPYDSLWKLLDYKNLHIITCDNNTKSLYRKIINLKQKFDLAIVPSPYIQHVLILPFLNATYKVCYDPIDLIIKAKKFKLIGNFTMPNYKEIWFNPYNDFYGNLLKSALAFCGISVNEKIPKIKNTNKLSEKLPLNSIIIFVYSKDELKAVPSFFWIKLCNELINMGFTPILLYDKQAREYTKKVAKQIDFEIKLVATDSIEKTISILNQAVGCICPEGGFMHISMLSNVPKIAVFSSVVNIEHRIPISLFSDKTIKAIQVDSEKLREYINLISSGYKGFFEYKPALVKEYINEYKAEVKNIFEREYKKFIDEILKFLRES